VAARLAGPSRWRTARCRSRGRRAAAPAAPVSPRTGGAAAWLPLGLALLLGWSGTGPACAPPAPAPRAVVPDTVYDAGRLKAGDPLIHAFKVLNTGRAALHIRKVKPG